MRAGQQKGSAIGKVALFWALAMAGCTTPSLYTTPRATPVARMSGLLAPQFEKRIGERGAAPGLVGGLRAGIMPRVDVGLRTSLGSLGADLKWNVVRSEVFDLALDAGAEGTPKTQYVHLPVLMGLNVSEDITLLPNTGFTLGFGTEPDFDWNDTSDSSFGAEVRPPAGHLFLRAGFGVQVRFTSDFAIQPELVLLRLVERHTPTSDVYGAGLGFIWGRQPY